MSAPTAVGHPLIEEIFGANSPAISHLSQFVPRAGQRDFAQAVWRAVHGGQPLLAEVGTGTGKTLGYLIAAAISGKKVVISTATRALQEQIVRKDAPLAQKILATYGIPLRVAMMKGLGNYVCRRRLHEALHERPRDPWLRRLREFADGDGNGDFAELDDVAEDDPRRYLIASSSETRVGAGCTFHETCFITQMRKQAEQADVVVVNHHLFFADLALRTSERGEFAAAICPYDAVILDEAHQLDAACAEFFGRTLASTQLEALARDAERTARAEGCLSDGVAAGVTELHAAQAGLFGGFGAAADRRRALLPAELCEQYRPELERLDAALGALCTHVLAVAEGEALRQIARRATEHRATLRALLAGLTHVASAQDAGESYGAADSHWVERQGNRVALGATPIDLAATLRERLWNRVPGLVLTSATLTTGRLASVAGRGFEPSFHFLRGRLGPPPGATELCVASPFDYAARALLYVPRDLPDVNDPAFDRAAAARVLELVEMSGGGVFVLATSHRAVRSLADALRIQLGSQLLVQGERPKAALLDAFRAHGSAVLVATLSFWEGVDVVGDALRVVVACRIPFPVPTEPLVAARAQALDSAGGNSFMELFVPQATITLRQGFGRLIRSEQDRGVVAILDKRVTLKGYGRALLAGLPKLPLIFDQDLLRARYAELFPPLA